MKETFDKILDIFMFRAGYEESGSGEKEPVLTTGSIVWGIILRTTIIVIISLFLMTRYRTDNIYLISLFLVWLLALYPGWRQYQDFRSGMDKFEEETLCGACRHFDPSSQLCTIYDEHPTKEYIPCDGVSWEPKPNTND